MRTRSRPDHADVVQRRLELLRAELASRWTEDDPGVEEAPSSRVELAVTETGQAAQGEEAEDTWWRPHTHVPGETEELDGPAGSSDPVAAVAPSAVADVPVPGRHAARRVRPTRETGPRGRAEAGGGAGGGMAGRWRDRWQDRVAFTPWHLAVIALGVAAALAVACWWVIRSDPKPQPVAPLASAPPLASLSASPQEPTTPGATPEALATPSGSAGTVTVDVEGTVRRPGIAVLPVGSRVIDAIKAAGGARHRHRDLAGLNLAAVLTDGQQIVVGPSTGATPGAAPGAGPGAGASAGAAPPGSAVPPAGTGALVDLNTAGLDELDTLPGVGPVTAQSILDWRDENGGFTSVDELLEVDGIGPVTLEKLTPLVTV